MIRDIKPCYGVKCAVVAMTCIAMTALARRLVAQPQPVPPAQNVVTVFLGQATVELFESPLDVTSVDGDVLEVSKALATVGTKKLFSLKGKRLGKTTLIVTREPPAPPEVYTISVIHDPTKLTELQSFIATSFPGCSVILRSSPDTIKLIVDGCVTDDRTAEQVMRLITDSDYPPNEIINRLTCNRCTCVCSGRCGRRFGRCR